MKMKLGIIILAKMDYIIRLGEIPYSIIKKEYGGEKHTTSAEKFCQEGEGILGGNLGPR